MIKEPLQKNNEPIGPHSKKYKEKLVRVKATEVFSDGTLLEAFGKLGYDVNWFRDEVRDIPVWLYKRCVQSGGEFELVDG